MDVAVRDCLRLPNTVVKNSADVQLIQYHNKRAEVGDAKTG